MLNFITIDEDRYCGSYSGSAFTAWIGDPPHDIDAGDMSCAEFWDSKDIPLHSRGGTLEKALQDLLTKSNRWIGSFDLIYNRLSVRYDGDRVDERFILVYGSKEKFSKVFPNLEHALG